MNEVILNKAPMLLFRYYSIYEVRYETSAMTVISIEQSKQLHELFVDIVGLIGGVFTLAIILDQLIHSSVHFLIEKHRLGKLK